MQLSRHQMDDSLRNHTAGASSKRLFRTAYGAKYPEISSISCAGFDANELIWPLFVGTIARFEVIEPSIAFSVETSGRAVPCGHNVRKPSEPGGTTVALNTNDWAAAGYP
jgi:hypothetical protein